MVARYTALRKGKRVSSLVLVVCLAVTALALAAPAAASSRTCIATNVTLAKTYGPGSGSVLERAVEKARAGDIIRVRGKCRGSFVIDKDLKLVGQATKRVPVATLVGRPDTPTVAVRYPATVTLGNLLITHWAAGGDAGSGHGIQNSGGILTVWGVTVTRNAAENGGGIYNDGMLTVVRSTVSDNSARNGGGIYTPGDLTVRYSTISGNTATYDGGGVYEEQTLLLSHSTVSANRAGWTGGGLYLTPPEGEVFEASIVAANSAGASGPDCAGAPVSNGYNLIGDTDGFFCAIVPVIGDQIGSGGGLVDAMLQGLAYNGGPTKTMALVAESPAVDVIPVGGLGADGATVLCPALGARDQRRIVQPQGPACDVGAFELVK